MRYSRTVGIALCVATAALLSACQGIPVGTPPTGSDQSNPSSPVEITPPAGERQTASPSASASPTETPSATPTESATATPSATAAPSVVPTATTPPGNTTPPVKPAPTKKPTPPADRPVPPPPAGNGGADYPGVVDLINKERQAAGLSTLTRSSKLEQGAIKCSQSNIAASQKAGTIALDHGLAGCGYENLFGASYKMTASEIVQGWMESPGHKRAMMDPSIKTIGVGYATGGEFFVIAAAFDW